ncbi:spinster family MFS transporter [Steroidobacter sp.]|uniref:spinster family MFS transporter n=1 Tax=Steroidobacter sp. TaxID=1978227 RepID=UPI001A5999F2|nr:MFS transporter [Steroidobacter sp.]MBL8265279.1 MFS transporter [Steroidobacter sp.]
MEKTSENDTGYRRYVLLVLCAIYAVNYIDRQVVAILLESIKAEFGVSDSLLGLLSGPAFALFYATMGIPIAIAADRKNRVRIVSMCLALFSLTTLLCGLAAQFWQLLVARLLTGVGEAGTGPASQSIISDLYAPGERATAQATYAVGVNLGIMVAFFGGGWIAHHYGWRYAFLAAAVPGFLLAVLARLTIREPERSGPTMSAQAPTFRECIDVLWQLRSYKYIVFGTAMSAFSGYGMAAFIPAFLMRSHGLDTAQVGALFALVVGLGGGLGTYYSGVLADRMSRRDARWNMYVPMLAALVSLPCWPVFLLSNNLAVTIVSVMIPVALSVVFIGPCVATIQTLAPTKIRARAAAIQLFVGNLIGLGLGPQVVGIASDLLAPVAGRDSLRYALAAGAVGSVIAAWSYWMASRTLIADLSKRPDRAPVTPVSPR